MSCKNARVSVVVALVGIAEEARAGHDDGAR